MTQLVVPAILSQDIREFKHQVERLAGVFSQIQIDFADGVFVKAKTIKPEEIIALPQGINFEAHLMTAEPDKYFSTLAKLGFKKVLVHFETKRDWNDIISQATDLNLEIGLCLNPETPIIEVRDIINKFKLVVLVSVHPGRQGQVFIPAVLDKVKQLRRDYPELMVEIDGGINLSNIESISQTGVNFLVIGSALINAQDLIQAKNNLESKLI